MYNITAKHIPSGKLLTNEYVPCRVSCAERVKQLIAMDDECVWKVEWRKM